MKTFKKVVKYWDEIQSYVIDYEEKANELDQIFKIHNVRTILELGCGTGTLSTCLAQLGYDCTGIDADADMLEIAKKKANERELPIQYFNYNMKNMDYDKEFDAVICFQAMTCIETNREFKKTLAAIYKALKPGGIFLFGVLNQNYELIEYEDIPFSMVDLAIKKDNYKIIRCITSTKEGNIEDWNAVYFIEENGELSMNVMNNRLRYYTKSEVEHMLIDNFFNIRNVDYKNTINMKNVNMTFTTMKCIS